MPRAKKSHLPDGIAPPRPRATPRNWRALALRRLRARLERDGFPRLEMTGLVAITGFAGFTCAWMLHVAGVASMGLRWGLATLLAYGVFLVLLRAWMTTRGEGSEVQEDTHLDLIDLDFSARGGNASTDLAGGGGEFGGGGASGSFDAGPDAPAVFDSIGDVDVGDGEGCLVVPVLLVLGVIVVGAAWVVLSAPTLFAELLLDAFLAAGLYRRLRHAPPAHWLETAVRRTAAPFALTLVLMAGGGFALDHWFPGADTLGQATQALRR